MFNRCLDSLTITSPAADYLMPDITGGIFDDDVVMLAMARVLLAPRGKKLTIDMNADLDLAVQSDPTEPLDTLDTNATYNICHVGEEDRLTIAQLSTMEYILKHPTVLQGFQFMEQISNNANRLITTMTRCELKVSVFQCSERRNTVVVVSNLRNSVVHLLASMLTMLVPWNFREQPVTEEEVKLICCLGTKTKSPDATNTDKYNMDMFIEMIEQMSSKFDFQTATKRMYLTGFESEHADMIAQELRNSIEVTQNRINEMLNSMNVLYDEMERKNIELCGITNGTAKHEDELLEYFLANDKLYVEDKRNGTITYYVGRTMYDFDPEAFETYMDNPTSMIYTSWNNYNDGRISKEEYLDLLIAIFRHETIKVKFVSKWKVGFGCGISPVRYPDKYPTRFRNYLPHPHLHYHGCTGSFGEHLNRAASSHNYVMAVDITSAETGNLNFRDSVVFPEFLRDLLTCKVKAFVLPDGTDATLEEAVASIKA